MRSIIRAAVRAAVLVAAAATPAAADGTVHLDGAVPRIDGGRLVLDNVRITGTGYSIADAWRLTYAFDGATRDLKLAATAKFANVGLFSDWLFARNVTVPQPGFSSDGVTYASGTQYTFPAMAIKPLVAAYALQPGHVMSWRVSQATAEFDLEFRDPAGKPLLKMRSAAGANIITEPVPILKSGTYRLVVTPVGAPSMTIKLMSYNANNRALKTVVDGSAVSEDFVTNIRDYAKFTVYLGSGRTLRMTKPYTDVTIRLVDAYGRRLSSYTGLPMIYDSTRSGWYTVFVYNERGWGARYDGTVQVTQTPALRAKDDLVEGAATAR